MDYNCLKFKAMNQTEFEVDITKNEVPVHFSFV